jgi:hypothetical protein
MKLFCNSAYGKTITNKEGFASTTYTNEKIFQRKLIIQDFKTLNNYTVKIMKLQQLKEKLN